MLCFVCLTAPATRRVTVTKTDNSAFGFDCCEGCEPRHIPQGDVLITRSEPLHATPEPGSPTRCDKCGCLHDYGCLTCSCTCSPTNNGRTCRCCGATDPQ